MLRRPVRVPKEAIKSILARGRAGHGSFMIVRFLSAAKPRFAVIVSKNVSALAVGRNRTKRRIWELIARTRENMAVPAEMVFLLKKGAAEASFSDLSRDFAAALEKAGLIDTKPRGTGK